MSTMEADVQARAARIAAEPLEPIGQSTGFVSGTGRSIAEIWTHRELLVLLVRREVKARYKGSSLGVVWSLGRPILQLLIYYFAIGQILGAARATPDFAIFVFVGLTMWGLIAEILSGSTTSLLANSGLVKKVYLPREIFPLSAVGGALFNFVVQFMVLLVAIAVISGFPGDARLLYVPVSILTAIIFSVAIGLILSAMNVYLRDTQHLVEIALIVLFWASPIVYSFRYVHDALQGNWLEQLYLMNPITIVIMSAQKGLWDAGSTATGPLEQYWPPDLEWRLLLTLVSSVVLLWIGQRVFSRLQGNFAQEL